MRSTDPVTAPFTIRIEAVSDAQVVVRARGELDLATARSFGNGVIEAIDLGRPENVIDMSGVPFCDSQGLTALLAATIYAESAGTSLAFTRLQPRVAKVLRVTGLDRRLTVG
jgi:anti-sigma B factor antagonist